MSDNGLRFRLLRCRKRLAMTVGCPLFVAVAVTTLNGADGADIRFAWDPSTTTGVTNYVLHAHTNALTATNFASALVHVNVGTNLTASVSALQPGLWSFCATAQKDGVQSAPSNVVNVEVPRPPPNMRVVVVQYSNTLSNWYDAGFFRLRLP